MPNGLAVGGGLSLSDWVLRGNSLLFTESKN